MSQSITRLPSPSRIKGKMPPKIIGLDFPVEVIDANRHATPPRLLTIDLEMSLNCNLHCRYCYSGACPGHKVSLPCDTVLRVIDEARDAGARMVVIVGGGEPFCYPGLREMLNHIRDLGMRALIFTNLQCITQQWADKLWDEQVAVVGKVNSLDAATHDYLVGRFGAHDRAMQSLAYLLAAGFPGQDAGHPLLGMETVVLRQNIHEIPLMWRWCRDRSIVPYFEKATVQGRLVNNMHLYPDPADTSRVFSDVSRLDAEVYGYEWTPRFPIMSYDCTRHYFAAYLKATGDLFPCPGVELPLGNVLRDNKTVGEMIDCDAIRILRRIEEHIKGKCKRCRHACARPGDLPCYGCRGQAWQKSHSLVVSDPDCKLYVPARQSRGLNSLVRSVYQS